VLCARATLDYSHGFRAAVMLGVLLSAAPAAQEIPTKEEEEDQSDNPRSSPTNNPGRTVAAVFGSSYQGRVWDNSRCSRDLAIICSCSERILKDRQ
jgi:hypothetical protein